MKCQCCGIEFFQQSKIGRPRKYCGAKCKFSHHYYLNHEQNKDKANQRYLNGSKYSKLCLYCGKEFKTNRESKKYCCLNCAHKANRSVIGTIVKCSNCGKEFEPCNKTRKYCSLECASQHKLKIIVCVKKCIVCGLNFKNKMNTPNRKFCSISCRDKNYCELHPYTAHNKGSRYRAKKKGSTIEKVDFEYVCERDKWICQICHKKVNRLRKYPDTLSPSLDHIKPISLGGTHSHDNVQLAHLRCNLSKGASVGYQMRLIG